MKKLKTKKILILLFLLTVFFNSCKTTSSKFEGKRTVAFKEYLKINNVHYEELNNSVYSAHYSAFLDDELKQQFDKNQYLRVNKVYVNYITYDSVEFSVYSDTGVFCLSTFDLDMDGQMLSVPQNGVVKVLHPITVEFFGDFELRDNILKTRKRSKTPFKEWYDYVNGIIKDDTIHFTEKYVGPNNYKFKKKWLAKTRKEDFITIYQPNLIATKHVNEYGLIYYTITGEFSLKQNLTDKVLKLMENVKY